MIGVPRMGMRRTGRGAARDKGEQVKEGSPRLAPVVDHPTRRSRHFRTLKSALGRSERDMLVVLRRKLAAEIDADNVRSAAMAALIRQFRDVDATIRAIEAAAAAAAQADDDDDDDGAFDLSKI
jgi:hypothetical protein